MARDLPIDSYAATRDAAIRKIKEAAADSDSEVLEELADQVDPRKRQARESNIQAVRMVVDKCLESYREGEYEFPVTVKMICEALQALKKQ